MSQLNKTKLTLLCEQATSKSPVRKPNISPSRYYCHIAPFTPHRVKRQIPRHAVTLMKSEKCAKLHGTHGQATGDVIAPLYGTDFVKKRLGCVSEEVGLCLYEGGCSLHSLFSLVPPPSLHLINSRLFSVALAHTKMATFVWLGGKKQGSSSCIHFFCFVPIGRKQNF